MGYCEEKSRLSGNLEEIRGISGKLRETQGNSDASGETGPASHRWPHRLHAWGAPLNSRAMHVHVPNQKTLQCRRQQGGSDGDRAEGGVGASGLSISMVKQNVHRSVLADLSAECGHGIR